MKWINRMAPFAAMALLGLIALGALNRPAAKDAAPYHDRIREAATGMPQHVGDWKGRESELPRSASHLLKPNVLRSRKFHNHTTGRRATFILVQCRDARDMTGHFPPRCYPANGWRLELKQSKEWQIGTLKIPGTEYIYTLRGIEGTTRKAIANFMILPNGRFAANMKALNEAAEDHSRHHYGAGQIQLVMDAHISEDDRHATFVELVGAHMDLIEVIRHGALASDDAPEHRQNETG